MMGDTGIERPQKQQTGIDKDHITIELEHRTKNNEMTLIFKEKSLDKLLSPNFLGFLVTMLVLISGLIFMCKDNVVKNDIFDFWKLILPVVTTYIGYAIGKGQSGS